MVMVTPPDRTILELLAELTDEPTPATTESLAEAAHRGGWGTEEGSPWFGFRGPIERLEADGRVKVTVAHEPFGETIVRHFDLELTDKGRAGLTVRPNPTWHLPGGGRNLSRA